jgi:hypothetical protein
MISAPPVQLATLPEVAWAVVRRFGQALLPDAIFLFGSDACGEAGPHSDLDFLVVIASSSCTRYARSVEARRLVGDIPDPKDIVVLTRTNGVVCSLASTMVREGIKLHG